MSESAAMAEHGPVRRGAAIQGLIDNIQPGGRLSDGYGTPVGYTSGLSGGQKQMVALARAFFGSPALLVLDKPEAGLDANLIKNLRSAVAQAAAQGALVILVTHDPEGWEEIATDWLDLAADGGWSFDAARETN